MTQGLKRQLRATQTYFPFMLPLKFKATNFCTRRFGMFIDRDFFALSRLQPVGLALDIGGNWGQSIEALKFCCRPREIVTFEPNLKLAHHLAKRFSRESSVRVEARALAEEAGRMRFHIPHYRGWTFDGLASLDRTEASDWLDTRRMARFDPAKVRIEEQEVEVRRLDDYGFAPDVVKIDVQGAEHAVVRGGIEMFREYRPATIVEAPSCELVAEFADLGMAPYYFDGEKLWDHSGGGWKNTLFLTREQAERVGARRPAALAG